MGEGTGLTRGHGAGKAVIGTVVVLYCFFAGLFSLIGWAAGDAIRAA
jgi:hypothetical protein